MMLWCSKISLAAMVSHGIGKKVSISVLLIKGGGLHKYNYKCKYKYKYKYKYKSGLIIREQQSVAN